MLPVLLSFRIFLFKGSPSPLFYRKDLWKRSILANQGDKITLPGANAKKIRRIAALLIYTGLALLTSRDPIYYGGRKE